jgi:signal transduction histidine kinase
LAAAIAPEVVVRYKNSATRLIGEKRSLDKVASNLMGNAIRYAVSAVKITLEESTEGFSLTVEDDGVGIPKEDRDRIFEPFVRLDESRQKSEAGGTGLGLAIVARIAELHGGHAVAKDSTLGGAKIIVTWPRQTALSEIDTHQALSAIASNASNNKTSTATHQEPI